MRIRQRFRAEESTGCFSSALFYLSGWIGLGFLACVIGVGSCLSLSAQDAPPASYPILGVPSFTPHHSVQSAEGELLLFSGEDRKPITPLAWQSPQPGQVTFSVSEEKIRLRFTVSPAQLASASPAVTGTVVHCTAEAVTQQEANIQIQAVWRHQGIERKHPFGMALYETVQDAVETQAHPHSWSSKWTWFFDQNALWRDNAILYRVHAGQAWTVFQSVRDASPPYPAFDASQPIGWTRLSAVIQPRQAVSFSIEIPYYPIRNTEKAGVAAP